MADQLIRAAGLLLWIVTTTVQGAVTPVPPMRLDPMIQPVAYNAELSIDPNREHFLGRIEIKIDVKTTTSSFWINASGLKFKRTVLSVGPHPFRARVVSTRRDWVELRFARRVPVGPALLTIEYEGALARGATDGLFKARSGDDWYVYSRFEPIFARRVFPSFDEPNFRAPWTLTLTIPILDVAISNAAQTSEEALPNMMKRVRFATTAPLPSHEVAFAVGPFDIVDGGKIGVRGIPLRYIVPRGHAPEVRYALSSTPTLVKRIESYLDQPYPADKLDMVAVPVTSGFDAVASSGVIDMPSSDLMASAKEETNRFQQHYAETASRELARQWFDSLRPLEWWDDAWLNRAFSTWLADRVVQGFNPEWHWGLSEDIERENAMRVDRLASTRALYRPVATDNDLGDVFGVIPSEKGSALLRTMEIWVGSERFKSAVRHYLVAGPGGKTRSEDFLAALTANSDPENPDLVAAFYSMTNQPGLPQLEIALDCGENRMEHPKLLLSQSRFEPIGRVSLSPAQGPKQPAQQWTFPACFQYGQGGDFGEICTVMRKEHQVLPLPAGEECPDWVIGNRDGVSYFLPVLSAPLALQLEHAPLLSDEAIPVLGDATLLSESQAMPIDVALTLAARFANDGQAPVVASALALAASVPPAVFAGDDMRLAYARFIRATFGSRATELGWLPHANEREVEGFLREDLLPFVADVGADPVLRRQADGLARDWLSGRANLGDMRRAILVTAAHFGNSDLFGALLAAANQARGAKRADLYAALGGFRSPQLLEEALSLSLSDAVDARDARTAMVQAAEDPRSAPQVLHFLEDHYDAVAKRFSEDAPAWLVQLGAHLCDASQQQEFANFLGSRIVTVPGSTRNLAQALETADLCIATREWEKGRLKTFLAHPPQLD